ncbi:MAG: hypothetical protein IJ617_00560 [Oscillospiraceae bacterium]|nr:hypothetical protein [Oscillospiraceae bacterium]
MYKKTETLEKRMKTARMGEPMRTICVAFDESEACVLKSAEFQSRAGTECLYVAGDRRGDPYLFSTLPRDKGEGKDETIVDTPLEKRAEELAGYASRTVRFARSMESASDLYDLIEPPDWVRIRVKNEGDRALRYRTPDGKLLRVAAGYTETIWPAEEVTAENCRTEQVRVTVDATTEVNVSQLELTGGSWREIGAVLDYTAGLNDYLLRIRGVGGSLLGVIQTTAAFSGKPALAFIDCKRYGAVFSVRNTGDRPVTLRFPQDGDFTCALEPNGAEYTLDELLEGARAARGASGSAVFDG